MVHAAGRRDHHRARHVAPGVEGGDDVDRRVPDHRSAADDRPPERVLAEHGLPEDVEHRVLRVVLVHRDLLEHDVALGVDLAEGRPPDHVGHHLERARHVLVEHPRVDGGALLVRAGVELGAHRVEQLVDLRGREAVRAAEQQVLEEVREARTRRRVSPREPVATKKPRAADRTELMCSVATRSPLSSCGDPVVGQGASCARGPGRRAGDAGRDRGRGRRAPPPLRSPPRPRGPRSAAATAAAAADRGQLLDGLAGDVGVLGEAQADAAALAVDLDHADGDLVALVEHVLDGVDPLAGRHVGDVQQAVGALGELDERAERGRLDDLALERVADLDLLGHRADPVDQGVALLAGLRVDEDVAVVVDVDLRVELLAQAADGLAALADEQADLVRSRS